MGSAPRAKIFGDVLGEPAGQPTEVCSGKGRDGTQEQKRAERRSKGGTRERGGMTAVRYVGVEPSVSPCDCHGLSEGW